MLGLMHSPRKDIPRMRSSGFQSATGVTWKLCSWCLSSTLLAAAHFSGVRFAASLIAARRLEEHEILRKNATLDDSMCGAADPMEDAAIRALSSHDAELGI